MHAAVSFGFTLPAEPSVGVVALGAPPPPECPGTLYLPQALPGHLCILQGFQQGVTGPTVIRQAAAGNPDIDGGLAPNANRMGALLALDPAGSGAHFARGTWAVTG